MSCSRSTSPGGAAPEPAAVTSGLGQDAVSLTAQPPPRYGRPTRINDGLPTRRYSDRRTILDPLGPTD
jgi:hypothetical protein